MGRGGDRWGAGGFWGMLVTLGGPWWASEPLTVGAPSGTSRSKPVPGLGAPMQSSSAQQHQEPCSPSAVPSHGHFGHLRSRTHTAPLPGACCKVGTPRAQENFGGRLSTQQGNCSLGNLHCQCIKCRIYRIAHVIGAGGWSLWFCR